MTKSLNNTVEIELDDKTYHLTPSLEAMTTVSRLSGGLRTIMTSVFDGNVDIIHDIIRAGLPKDALTKTKLGNAIYKTGVVSVIPAVAAFVFALQNGGKVKASDDAESEGEDENKDESTASEGEGENPQN